MQKIDFQLNHAQLIKGKLHQTLGNEKNFISNASNFVSLVYHNFDAVSWAGFYFLSNEHLVLGPFQGKSACVRIPISQGVCGSAARNKKTIIVPDVHKFPGYIPCDPTANSEMVIPVIYKNKLIGVFDLDSPIYNRFTQQESELISELLEVLLFNSIVEPLIRYYESTA
ncbi:MAG: Free methionine-(R)-sulfoxide reductase, contains GAF domain [Candidatus Kapaibacterium sp.]|jgi:GAF domain-containing protein|nr:MAG: Free methionine-(R)-sulfoxide reductase, contains GAF domain [Candidatus Kapabacteria bacterium]ROL56617.1 MAG: GAF domain-containing protein [Bacteroidetes/Chlorobi group bacterium Naka2016]